MTLLSRVVPVVAQLFIQFQHIWGNRKLIESRPSSILKYHTAKEHTCYLGSFQIQLAEMQILSQYVLKGISCIRQLDSQSGWDACEALQPLS